MGTSWFVGIREEEVIKFVEEQENPNTKRKTVYDVELFNNFIQTSNAGLQLVLQHLFTSFHHNFWTTTFGVGKKDGSDHVNPRVSEDFFQASTDILTKAELPPHNFYSDAVLKA